ncbi:hypothetical protein E4T56_gene18718, partial [Termitomyces sp. T112]
MRRRKIVVSERRIGDDGNAMLLAPGHDRMRDGALLQVIEHLVAGDPALAADREQFVQIVGVEIADAPGADLACRDQLLEGRDGVLKRIGAAPRALAGRDRAAARRVARQHLRDQEGLVAPARDRIGDDELGIAIHLGGVD